MRQAVLLVLLLTVLPFWCNAACPSIEGQQLSSYPLSHLNNITDMIWGDEAYSNVGDYDLSVGYIASQSNQSILSYELYYGKLYFTSYGGIVSNINMLTLASYLVAIDSVSGVLFRCYPGRFCTNVTIDQALNNPQSAAFNTFTNEFIIADTGNDVLVRTNFSGHALATVGGPGTGDGQFSNPTKVLVNELTGDLIVADVGNNRIQLLNATGSFMRTLANWTSPSQLLNMQIAYRYGDAYITICLGRTNQVLIYNMTEESITLTLPVSRTPIAASYQHDGDALVVLFENPDEIVLYSTQSCNFTYGSHYVFWAQFDADGSYSLTAFDIDNRTFSVSFASVAEVDPLTGDVIPSTVDTSFTAPDRLIGTLQQPIVNRVDGVSVLLTYQEPGNGVAVVGNSFSWFEQGVLFQFQGLNLSTYGPNSIETAIAITNFSFSSPSNLLQIIWQLGSPLEFETQNITITQNNSMTFFTLPYTSAAGRNPVISDEYGLTYLDGIQVICADAALVDGFWQQVQHNFDPNSLQLTVTFPHFLHTLLYDPIFAFNTTFYPLQSITSASTSYNGGYDAPTDPGEYIGIAWGAVIGFFLIMALLIGCTVLIVAVIVVIVVRVKKRRQPFIDAESNKSLRTKEVETLWFLAEGKKRNAKQIFKAEKEMGKEDVAEPSYNSDDDDLDADNPNKHEEGEERNTDEEMGWGTKLKNMAPMRKKKAKYYFEFVPPETVELIAGFVEGKPQHTIG